MGYQVPDAEIIAESMTGGDGQQYGVRRYSYPSDFDGQLVICAKFDANSCHSDMSVSDGDGHLFSDLFRAPFSLDTLDSGPELSESELDYINTFAGVRIYYGTYGISMSVFESGEDLDAQYQLDVESAV